MGHQPDDESVINLSEALVITAGDRDMLIEMGRMFLEEGPRQLQDVQAGIESGDAKAIRETAHTLKGSVVIFGAAKAEAAALAVQLAASDEDLPQVAKAWPALQREMERLLRDVQLLCDG